MTIYLCLSFVLLMSSSSGMVHYALTLKALETGLRYHLLNFYAIVHPNVFQFHELSPAALVGSVFACLFPLSGSYGITG